MIKLKNINDVNLFIDTVNKCEGDVWLVSIYNDRYNLKSALSQYVAIGQLLTDRAPELDLYCQLREDEWKFIHLFDEHPELLGYKREKSEEN